ncbi:Uncharacterised protein [Yersinia intermedia]|uniref:hypothetical protein n=1 Tax=Yersinia intermedia TaxID=631 RepID=UPI0005DF9DC9|nr:hypothetical protein [Yersinia intermedia]CNB98672.1 Uncharacterised protein [Yersinia intermedia]CNH16483.1 Uncharacterised protein [Yersinia intermedia]
MKHLPVLFSLLLFSAGSAYGADFPNRPDKVVSDISNCAVTNIGTNTWKATFSVNWLEMPEKSPGGVDFGRRTGRGVLTYLYDSKGNAINAYIPSTDITMNNHPPAGTAGTFTKGKGYLSYGQSDSNVWGNYGAHSANFVVNVKRTGVTIMAIYPADVYGFGMIYDQAGAVYFTVSPTTSTCQFMTNPDTPPVIVNLTMNAPDWNLGEIATGQQQKVMTNNADRLCISYLSTESAGKDFVVNATNANGIENNRFILKHSLEPANTLPYTLTLDSMGKRILLPNTDNSSIRFEDSGNQTCFTPTFDLYGSDNQEIGDYTDVITYEIVTKS